jgi:hypothetical protein
MRKFASLSTDYRVIEIDPADGVLGMSLVEAGFGKYLAVVRSERKRSAIVARYSKLANHVTATRTPQVVRHNNADVLILSGVSVLHLWKYSNVRNAQLVAWKFSLNPITLLAMLGWLIRFAVGQYKKPLWWNSSGGPGTGYLVSRISRPKRCYHAARHFIPHHLGLQGLFAKFHEQRVAYVVLRWFEELPEREPTGDIDLLVADEHLERALQILHSGPAVRPCDLYTPSGLPESNYQKVSYYPPDLARRLLTNSRLHRGYCRVPSQTDYFHCLAYHAVYHKGPQSNLPGSDKYKSHRRSARDFTAILSRMAGELGIDAEISLHGLHAYLQRQQWAPPDDLLLRLAIGSPGNRWLAELATRVDGVPTMDPGLAVFVVRQSAVDAGVHEKIISTIERRGFMTLARKTLTSEEIRFGAPRTRGGNWGPGPKDHLGGAPAILLAAYDPKPLRPTRAQHKRFPLVSNARTLIKEEIRREINREIAPRHPINGVHSSDYGAEAHHFLQMFAPELLPVIHQRIAASRGQAGGRMAA